MVRAHRFFASSSTTWFPDFYPFLEDETAVDYGTSLPRAIGAAATPALWVGFVYLASQFTWPRQLKPQRSASLQSRSPSGMIPKALGGVMLLVFTASVAALLAVSDVAGLEPVPEREFEQEDYWIQEPAEEGIRAAGEVLPLLALCLFLLLLVAVLSTVVILRRKPLPGISEHDNRLLRITWLNRLYRTVTFLIAVNAGEALHYKARWLSSMANDHLDSEGGGAQYHEQLSTAAGVWDETANFAVLAVAVGMLFWRPPTNFDEAAPSRAKPGQRLRDQLFAVQYISASITLIALAVYWPVAAEGESFPTGERATRIILLVALAALFYLLANAAAMSYVTFKARSAAALPRHAARLPLWSYALAAILVLGSAYYLLNPPVDYLWGLVPANNWFVLGTVTLLVLAHTGFTIFTRRMVIPWDVRPELEIRYRQVLELRSLRTIVSAATAMLFLGYGFPGGWALISILLLFLPALLAIKHPTRDGTAASTMAGQRG